MGESWKHIMKLEDGALSARVKSLYLIFTVRTRSSFEKESDTNQKLHLRHTDLAAVLKSCGKLRGDTKSM